MNFAGELPGNLLTVGDTLEWVGGDTIVTFGVVVEVAESQVLMQPVRYFRLALEEDSMICVAVGHEVSKGLIWHGSEIVVQGVLEDMGPDQPNRLLVTKIVPSGNDGYEFRCV